MTFEEFSKRTKFEPTYNYFFNVIYEAYMQAGDDVDKDTFCKLWLKGGGIQRAYDAMCIERNNANKKADKYKNDYIMAINRIDALYGEIRALQYKLDKIKDIIINE